MTEGIRIVPYDPAWPARFEAEKDRLLHALVDFQPVIEHIGSTAVTGLSAKPIIDILLGVPDAARLELSVPALTQLGYQYRNEYERVVRERRFFTLDRGTDDRFNLHVALLDSHFCRERLHFRDRLRQCSRITAAYCRLKFQLVQHFRYDPQGYSNAKTSFVAHVLSIS